LDDGAFRIRRADWQGDEPAIRRVRQKVFIDEQGVRPDEEWDGLDARCLHVLAIDGQGAAIGTARLTEDGKVGRMAVLGPWRKKGVGAALLEALIAVARDRGIRRLSADAQVRALGFYEEHGFVAEGPEFLDARIPHRRMYRDL